MPPGVSNSEESDEERAPNDRYVRSNAAAGVPVYQADVGPLHWAAHEAYDEEDGLECHWHKLTARNPGTYGEADADSAWGEAVISRALLLLRAWQAHHHPLLLRCATSAGTCAQYAPARFFPRI